MKYYHGSPHNFSKFSLDNAQGVNYGTGIYFTLSREEAITYATSHDEAGYLYTINLDTNNGFNVRSEAHAKAVSRSLGLDWNKVETNEIYKDTSTGSDDTDIDNYYIKIVDEYYEANNLKYYEVKEVVNALIRSNFTCIIDPVKGWVMSFDAPTQKITMKEVVEPNFKLEKVG